MKVEYEVYREKFKVTAWKDGAVYRTQSMGTGWFDDEAVRANRPWETGVIYVAASDEFAQNSMTVRKKKKLPF